MHLTFTELSLWSGDFGYGSFNGRAELDTNGDPVVIELEGTVAGSTNWRFDIGDLTHERMALRRKFGTPAYLEDVSAEVRDHQVKWVLFHALSRSLKIIYKEEIDDYLSRLWSAPANYNVIKFPKTARDG